MVEPELEEGPPPRRSTALSAIFTYVTYVGSSLLSLGNVLVVSRSLGPSGRGDVAFLTTVAFLTSNLAMLGVQEANANFGGQREEKRPSLATNSVLLSIALGALGALAVALLVIFVPDADGDLSGKLIALALVSLPMLVLQNFLIYLVQSAYRFTVTNLAWLLPAVVNVALNGALAAAGVLSVGLAFLTWVGGQALATGLLVWAVATHEGFGRPDPELARESLGFGVKTHAARVMMLGNYRLDQWLLGALGTSRQLGLYSVAVAWSEVLFFLPTTLQLVQRPSLVRAGREEAVRQSAVGFRVAIVATAAIGLVMMLAAPILCVAIFGEDFRGSITDLRLLVPGALGMVALKLMPNVLTAQGKPLRGTWGVAAAFVATVALDFALIPNHGDHGASLASTLAYLFGGVVVVALFVTGLAARVRDLVPRPQDVPWFLGKVRASLSRTSG